MLDKGTVRFIMKININVDKIEWKPYEEPKTCHTLT